MTWLVLAAVGWLVGAGLAWAFVAGATRGPRARWVRLERLQDLARAA